ncbi:TerB family tellurite resistance protein [Falsiruegeria mediterranea]|uniref:TerB family tellurite resistance protein n=1 Tax=Falsiruegeria mediterranea TaxID=1280832 RepID=UPI0015F285F1|nr:TerB family tellurite resistance protein [Falsiruegeria mediterranea]
MQYLVMTNTCNLNALNEHEAAVALIAATVVADGKIDQREVDELKRQMTMVLGPSANRSEAFDKNFVEFLNYLRAAYQKHPLKLSGEQVETLATKVDDIDLQIAIMNAVIEVSYSDDEYHTHEKDIVSVLRDQWGV